MPYHVIIDLKSNTMFPEVKLDLTKEQLEERVLALYRARRPIVIGGKTIPLDDIARIRITWTDVMSDQLRAAVQADQRAGKLGFVSVEWEIANRGKDVTDDQIIGPAGGQNVATRIQDPWVVFVVHGRNAKARQALFTFLRSIRLDPVEWSEWVKATGKGTPYVGEILDTAFSKAQAVLVLMTPDDEARLREPFRDPGDPEHETKLTPQARSNVLFEAGMAMGRFPDRTVLVEIGNLRPFSDIVGRHVVRLDNSPQKRQELAKRLETAGCPVNLDGTDWYTAGNFDLGFLNCA
jgi:predicted nucleotide-binding protein